MNTKTTQHKRLIFLFFIFNFSFFIHVNAQTSIIATVAGTALSPGFYGDGAAATAAEISNPMGLAYSKAGFLYIADLSNYCVRLVNLATVEITTVAGIGGSSGYTGNGGAATSAKFGSPCGIAVDEAGNVLIADKSNSCIRAVNTSGIVILFAGNHVNGFSGDGGQATSAELYTPEGVAVDATGNVFISDKVNNRIRKVTTAGIISTIAGNGVGGFSGDGSSATSAEINAPYKIALDAAGNLYIADEANNRIRMVNTAGIISTAAGNGTGGFSGDGGQATTAELHAPEDITIDKFNNMYIADGSNNRVRKVTTAGIITTVEGNGHGGVSGNGGAATSAELDSPTGVTTDSLGNLYTGEQMGEVVTYVDFWLRVIATVTANESCNASTDGSASVTASLGVVPYTYSWVPGGATTSSISGLSAGSYSVFVSDKEGITGSSSVVITKPELLTVSASTTANVTCYGGNNGSVTCSPSGGTSPYTYSWATGGNTHQTATGLSIGTYTIYLTDNNGCTATAGTIVTQPTQVVVFITQATNDKCAGAFDAMALAAASGGAKPYTYSWAPAGGTKAEATGLGTGVYTVYVTDASGCTGSATDDITSPAALTITTTNISSLVYAATTGGTPPYTYTWTPGGSTTAILTGISAGIYTVVVEDANGCMDSVVVNETLTITTNDSMYRFPRWSKRGVYLKWAPHYYNPDSIAAYGTPFVNYCAKNHITYVLMDGVDNDGNPNGPFHIDRAYVEATPAGYLISFISALKAIGVEQVGVICYQAMTATSDSNSFSVKNFDVNNFSGSVMLFNTGLPWNEKVDILSLDEEFNIDTFSVDITPMEKYARDSADFYAVHVPMLRSMYNAAHECNANFLRVEDYIGPPLNPITSATNTSQSKELDSISKYTDRILMSAYTYYSNVLWDRNDWVPAYDEIAKDNNSVFYNKKEIWPVYSAENTQTVTTCQQNHYCGAYAGDDFSGTFMCDNNITPDSLEQYYYEYNYPLVGSFKFSMEHHIWTPDVGPEYYMGKDTNFEIEGNMWFDAECLPDWTFDTNMATNAIHFWVDLGHDILWTGSPVTLTAKVDGGSPPYYYIWYNEDNNDAVLYNSAAPTYTATFPSKISVLAVDVNGRTAMDYVCVYKDTCFNHFVGITSITEPDNIFSVYPNPASSLLNIEMYGYQNGLNYFDLYDIYGQNLKTQEIDTKNTVVNIGSLSDGVYFYRIFNDKEKSLKSGKLVIIH